MKKSYFLGRKTQSLFDTNVQMKDMDNMELVLDSAVIPDSGTAKVRSRPTVKHFNSSGEGALGFAVPTPKVPVLPPLSVPQGNSQTGSTGGLPNGGMITVDDPEEGEILIPAPPSMAPPPPPPTFTPPSPLYIPPPQEFFGELDPPVDLASLQPPSMPAPKPPYVIPSFEEQDLARLQPPPMAPPKPPSDTPNTKASVPISRPTNPVQDTAECPKFIPQLPPMERPESPLPKAQKTPPPKPARMSSIYSFDMPPAGVPPSTPPATPASSFKPQTTAKLYNVQKSTLLTSQTDREQKTQHILLLEDSSGNPVGVHINGKTPTSVKDVSPSQTPAPPAKPSRRNSSGIQLENDLQEMQKNIDEPVLNRATTANRTINGEPIKVVTPQEVPVKTQTPTQASPPTDTYLPGNDKTQVKDLPATTHGPRSYSPLLNRKLKTLRGHESSSGKEAAASPMALLMAAKERDKQRVGLSRQSSTKSSSSTDSASISNQSTETRPNSFVVTTGPPESVPVTPAESQSPFSSAKPTPVPQSIPSTNLPLGPVKQKADTVQSASPPALLEDSIAFIPPPPEFANSDPEDEGPPSTPPPDPPKSSVIPSLQSVSQFNGPATPPKSKPPSSIPLTASNTQAKMPNLVKTPPTQPKVQPPVLPPVQSQTQTPIQPPPPPKTQPPAPPKVQTQTQALIQPPPPPKIQAPAPPTVQTQTQAPIQPPPPPKTQPPAPPQVILKTQPQVQPKTQVPTPPPAVPQVQLKTQVPTPPPAPPQVQLKNQVPTPPPVQTKTLPPTPPPVQPKKQSQTTPPSHPKTQLPAPPTQQAPPSVAASQATLLSILQKKMLEMDPKFSPVREPDSSAEDWHDGATSPPPKPLASSKRTSQPVQGPGLDMKELESKVVKKAQDKAAKVPASNGPHSKQQFGMTFTVRPGTKQPITPVIKTE